MVENESLFHVTRVQSCNTNAVLLSFHPISACNNIHEKTTNVWLVENESLFHVTRVQSCNTNAVLLSLKIFLVLINTKLHQKSCCYLYWKYTLKTYALLIGWNRVHLSCDTGAKLEHEYKLQIASTLSKFRLPCLWEMPFSCILLLSNNMISRAISCKGALEQFIKDHKLHSLGLWKIYSIFNTKSCQY